MIEGKNGYPVDIAEIDLELRDKIVSHIQKAIIHKLEAVKKLLQIPGYEDICAGVHTYAVEEYGKILFLGISSPSPAITTN
jgi:hypothetical protein